MGRYVPPEFEGTTSANKLAGKHALGARARKIKEGILTVRFEMPFAVWCFSCPKPTIIGQGVRFNAEKKKVGNYHSTPIYAFRMKHAACGGWIEIRTDPKNTAYVVMEGGKKRDTGEDRVREGEEGMEILTAEEREKRREDAFSVLEGRKEEKAQEKEHRYRISELQEASEKHWEDPYEASRRLRKGFRADRKVREKDAEVTETLRNKMGLDIELLPEHEDDATRAAFVEFGNVDESNSTATSRPLSALNNSKDVKKTERPGKRLSSKEKAAAEVERRRQALQQQIRDNTRAAQDPFLNFSRDTRADVFTARALSGIKRKREREHDAQPSDTSTTPETAETFTTDSLSANCPIPQLVVYDSD
ncbi:Protein saf4 [Zalaria obscura]|uniref:Protein saf4 n=1 Tax=Zalaria obscura TaxID=2024903 RepID=A0ACC3SKR2_9PEZI